MDNQSSGIIWEGEGIEEIGRRADTKEIVIRITSPDVPNLTLVDLPGLVMVACTDQGQPENIKEQLIVELYSK